MLIHINAIKSHVYHIILIGVNDTNTQMVKFFKKIIITETPVSYKSKYVSVEKCLQSKS